MKLIIFDLDGTLLNTIEDLGNAVNVALERNHFPLHTTEEYYKMVGHGVRNLVRSAMPEAFRNNDSLVDELLAVFIESYSANIAVHTEPYPGIVTMIRNLSVKGYSLAVASNKFQSGAESLVGKFFPDTNFVKVLGNMAGAPLKPSPEIVFMSMEAAGVGLSEAQGNVVMVGDSGTDIATAANAGIPSIAVSWGFRPVEDLTDATRIAYSAEELESLIEETISRP